MTDAGTFSSCNTCGKPVIWAKRADDPARWSAPLDPDTAHSGVTISENLTTPVVTYRYHQCKIKDVEAYAEVLAIRSRIMASHPKPPTEVIELDREAERERMQAETVLFYTEAVTSSGFIVNTLEVSCPRCGSDEGERCVNMSRGKLNGSDIRHPHDERIESAMTELEECE